MGWFSAVFLMALQSATGAVQWLAADPATTVYSVSGLGFRPVAIRVYWAGLGSSTDLISNANHIRAGHGFAVSTSSRRCIALQNHDNVPSTICTTALFTDCLAATVTNTGPARDGALDINAINDDGFDFIVDDAAPVDITVMYDVWGGSGVTVAVVGDITEPAATGDQDYTVTGFDTAGLGDQVVFFAGIENVAADTVARNHAGMCIGCATSGASAQNVIVSVVEEDNLTSTDNFRYSLSGECLGLITAPAGTQSRAKLTQFNTNGFRLNWIERTTTDRRYIFLAIKGGFWQAGGLSVNSSAVGNTTIVSGLPFVPQTLCGATALIPESTAGTPSNNALSLAFGTATSAGVQQGQGMWSTWGVPDSAVALTVHYTEYLPSVAFSTPDEDNQDIATFWRDGFTQRWTGPQNLGDQQLWSWYVASGVFRREFLLVR